MANLGAGGYPELGSKYKAMHVKQLIFWIAIQSQKFADSHQEDPKLQKW